jgi:hypothetical protein
MNSLRVGGGFMWSSYGTGVGGTIGMSEGRCCGHYLGSHALFTTYPGGWWAPRTRHFQSSISYNPLYPIFSVHFLLPPDSPLVTLA